MELVKKSTTNVAAVYAKDLFPLPLALPSFEGQRLIVDEIEKQFTRLDAGVASLKRVRAALKRYRASVLKAACEGRLVPTEAELARREGRSYEPATDLLDRILAERRNKWESAQLTKFQNNGRLPRDDYWKANYEEPRGPKALGEDLGNLPEGWAWASFEQLSDNFDGRRIPLKADDRNKRSGPYPYYGASGIIDDIDDYLFDGDFLLIGEDGANLLARSTPIAFRASGKFWVNNHAHVVQTHGAVPLVYLEIFLNGKDLKFYVTGSAQPKLTQAAMNKLPVPLPPLAEQHRIIAEVERRLSVIEELEGAALTNLKRAVRLRQSILHSAFTGNL